MVERYQRARGKKKLLGNHQKCWIWGRNTILETLRGGIWTMHELWIGDDVNPAETALARPLAEALGIPVHISCAEELRSRCHSTEHQGFVAKMAPFPYASPDEIFQPSPRPLILVCDRIQDPFNFGAMIRSAEVLGATAVVTGNSHQVGVTSLVARTSAGAVNHLPIVRTELILFLERCRRENIRVVGLDMNGDVNSFTVQLTGPVALVVGNEGQGISTELRGLCDTTCEIPQSGKVQSLNAAVALSVLLHEAQRQNAATA